MRLKRTDAEYAGLVRELCRLPDETEWVEFKTRFNGNHEVGEYISALSNAAALVGEPKAYLVWGIEDASHRIVGTDFRPGTTREGNELLESWLAHQLTPALDFRFRQVEIDGANVVLLEIPRAFRHPVRFESQEFIRVGSYKKNLKNYPEKERALWRVFDDTPFEKGLSVSSLGDEDVLSMLDYPAYFELLELPVSSGTARILDALEKDALIIRSPSGGWDITNLGAVLFARRLADFEGLGRKAARVVVYKGNDRVETQRERAGTKGYASGFEGLLAYIGEQLPENEVIGEALRRTVLMYPAVAVRELVANALIHQDFFATGTGPMVEIFDDRMEITNPGTPLVDPDRFLDNPPQSRNEQLAAMMRRFGICEERGSGVDKVVTHIELFQLPAPLFEATGESTRVVLFSHRPLAKMGKEDRIRACYQHACLKFVNREHMTNTTIRERFGIEDRNSAQASRIIRVAVQARVVVPHDERAAPKLMRYVPWWA